jgi:hypothetical protein
MVRRSRASCKPRIKDHPAKVRGMRARRGVPDRTPKASLTRIDGTCGRLVARRMG